MDINIKHPSKTGGLTATDTRYENRALLVAPVVLLLLAMHAVAPQFYGFSIFGNIWQGIVNFFSTFVNNPASTTSTISTTIPIITTAPTTVSNNIATAISSTTSIKINKHYSTGTKIFADSSCAAFGSGWYGRGFSSKWQSKPNGIQSSKYLSISYRH